MPPPAKVLADAEVRLMVPVPVTVKFVEEIFQPPFPAIVHVPEPTFMVLVFELELLNDDVEPVIDTLYVPALKVPWVTVAVAEERASCNVTEPDGESTTICCVNVLPALVMV